MSGTAASGRKPKPTALKIIEGNRGRRPLNDREPQPRAVAPEKPEWLTPFASAEWDRLAEEMAQVPGWLTAVDRAVLAAYCQAYGRWQQAEMAVSEHGQVFLKIFIDPSGTEHIEPKARPEVKIAKDERAAMKGFAVELGITPAARARIHVGPSGDGDGDDLDP